MSDHYQPVVTLDTETRQRVLRVGDDRHRNVVTYGLRDPWGAPVDQSRARHRLGALAEAAVARWLGVAWNPNTGPDFHRQPYDVAHCQVRATRHERGGLLVHRSDPSDQPYVVCHVDDRRPDRTARVRVLGWQWGHVAKQRQWWSEPQPGRGVFMLPQRLLLPPNELPDRLATRGAA